MACAATCRSDGAKVLICATPKLQQTAKNVVAMHPDKLAYLHIEMSHFSSMVPSTILPADEILGHDVVFIFDVRFEYLLQALAVLYELPRYGARTFNAFCSTYLCAIL